MKTLKQHLETWLSESYIEPIISDVKEWLEQKRQYLRERKNITDREAEIDLQNCLFINKLLEELKQ